MKDAQGHGSNPRGGAGGDAMQAARDNLRAARGNPLQPFAAGMSPQAFAAGIAHQTGVNQVPAGIASHPDVIRASEAAGRVRSAGGSAMDAALAAVKTGFDQTAANRSQAERTALYRKVTGR